MNVCFTVAVCATYVLPVLLFLTKVISSVFGSDHSHFSKNSWRSVIFSFY